LSEQIFRVDKWSRCRGSAAVRRAGASSEAASPTALHQAANRNAL